MIWTGGTSKKLGLIEPAGSTEVILEVVPQDTGLQVVGVTAQTYFRSDRSDQTTTNTILISHPQITDISE